MGIQPCCGSGTYHDLKSGCNKTNALWIFFHQKYFTTLKKNQPQSSRRFVRTPQKRMEQASYVYIDGVKLPTSVNEVWTVSRIDQVHREMYINNMIAERCRDAKDTVTQEMINELLVDLYIPPNKWYPLNIFGLPNYSITKSGKLKKNKTDRVVKGTVHAHGNVRHSLTNSAGTTQEYADRLVAKMFLGPPPALSSIVRHKDKNLRNCNVDNLEWINKKKQEPQAAAEEAKTVYMVPSMNAAPPRPPRRAPLEDDNVFSKVSATLARLKQEQGNSPLNEKITCTTKTVSLITFEEVGKIETPAKSPSKDDIKDDDAGWFVKVD